MPSINLIANKRANKKKQEQTVRQLAYGVMAEVGIVLVAFSVLNFRWIEAHWRLQDLDHQLVKLEPKVSAIHRLQADTAAIMPRVTMLTGARTDNMFWYNAIAAISSSLPDKTWITTFGTSTGGSATGAAVPGSASGPSPSLNIQGVSLDPTRVGEMMLNLNTSPRVDHAELAYVQHRDVGAIHAVDFQMTVHLKPEQGAVAAATGTQNGTKS